LLLLAIPVLPFLLWTYNIQQAGENMEVGLVWPEPRLVDSLPLAADEQALQEALGHLAAAVRWRPNDDYAHWLAGRIYIAQEDWLRAEEAYRLASERAPGNPLLAWEQGLVYEQLVSLIALAAEEPLLPDLLEGEVTAPQGESFDSPVCTEEPGSCWVGETVFAQPLAALPQGPTITAPTITAPTLFLHPPSSVQQQVQLPEGNPALSFLLGLSPTAHPWGSDGATMRIWLVSEGEEELLYERNLPGNVAAQGWIADWLDLSEHAGGRVTLRFESDPGPSDDPSADWYGWGDLTLTTAEAARLLLLRPEQRMVAAWQRGEFDSGQLRNRAGAASGEEADRWLERAERMEAAMTPQPSPDQ
jgi:hypothetical protein